MAVFTGYQGSVKIGTNTVAETTEWTLDISADTDEWVKFGSSGWQNTVVVSKSWSGSITAKWDMTDTNGQAVLQGGLVGASVSLKLYIDGTKNYNGTAIVTGVSISSSADATVEVSFDFTGDGALVYSAT